MKEIRINKIKYTNFKGIKDYELVLKGLDTSVSAKNAVGKTTLYDGFLWLLFGKDSAENSKFGAKPVDNNGLEVLGKEPVVEAELIVNGEIISLRRELKEVWSTIKGRLEKERKSDKTVYYINEVPCKTQKEYQTLVDDLIQEETFKLLTNPASFNNLHWTKRREVLLELINNVSDKDVIDSNEELSSLDELLKGRSVDEQKKIINAKKKDIKNSIDGMAARFDEAERAMPDLEGYSIEKLEEALKDSNTLISAAQNKISELKNGGAVTDLKNKRGQLDLKLVEAKAKFFQTQQLSTEQLSNDVNTIQQDLNKQNQVVYEIKTIINNHERFLEEKSELKKELLAQHKKVKENTFDEHRTTCKMCGQDLPGDQVEQMKITFNKEKSEDITKIINKGQSIAVMINDTSIDLEKKKEELLKEQYKSSSLSETLNNLNEEIELTKGRTGQFEDSDEYKQIVEEIQGISKQMLSEQVSVQEEVANQENIIQAQTDSVDHFRSSLSLFDIAKKQKERIEQLMDEEKTYKDTYMKLEGQAFLLDEFTRTKVQLLEKEINAKFKMANFKLFDIQKNGGINEVCEATYKGAAYSTNLNNAARINVGLDIINTLSSHYDVSAPIFVDNAESVNELISTEAQMISLIVSEDSIFKVEVQG